MYKKLSESFFEKVYEVVKLIPSGRVTTYGAIANYLGITKSARMVGWALNQAKYYKEEIPAHRVVNKQGLLTGKHHFLPEKNMEQLLNQEGVQVKNNQIQHFETIFWSPDELEIT
ncbi:MAG: cysteine methyltransferase [Candidatus Amoebophilus sp. 36-38]|nr:MAG: cysteine methyltransferase [Candidatus Amoebophilus sp. 36-38]